MLNPREGMDPSELCEFYYSLHRKLLRLTGIDPLAKEFGNRVWANRVLFIISSSALLYIILPLYNELMNQPATMTKFMEIMAIDIVIFNCICKFATLLYYRDSVIRQEKTWNNFWRENLSSEEISELCAFSKKAKALTLSYVACGYALQTMYCIAPIVSSWNNNFVNGITVPFYVGVNIESTSALVCLYVTQVTASVISCATIVGVDLVAPTFVLQACGQFRVLQAKLRNMGKQSSELEALATFCNKNSWDLDDRFLSRTNYVADNLNKCIQRHQAILNASFELEESFNLLGLIQAVFVVFELCLGGIGILLLPGERVKYFIQTFAGMYQVFLYSWPPTELMTESMEVANAAFHYVPWYHCSKSVQTNVLMIVMRAQKGCRYSGGKFFDLSMELFSQLISQAMSAFAVMRRFM